MAKPAPGGAAAELKIRVRIQLGEEIALGPGKAELLAAIAACGSISAAGRELGMSYRRAWQLVDTMNRCFREPLVVAVTGGSHGGGARLSPLGEQVLREYLELQQAVARAAAPRFRTLKKTLARPLPAARRAGKARRP